MRGIVSFHAVDQDLLDTLIAPLVAGDKVNPEAYLEDARRLRTAEWQAARYRNALDTLLGALEPPPPPAGGVWQRMRARLERVDAVAHPTAQRLAGKVERELHLYGRPFLIMEGSAERVAVLVDEYRRAEGERAVADLVLEQLLRIDPKLPAEIEPDESAAPPADARYREELLQSLRTLYDLGQAARQGRSWRGPDGPGEPAAELLARELPWRAVELHARARPFWIARDVDGLETVCRAAGVEAPEFLVPPARLILRTVDALPVPCPQLGTELRAERDVGAFVAAGDVERLLDFLNTEGSRMIRAASRHDEGATCATLLRKIRECAYFAQRQGWAYVESSGVSPVVAEPDEPGEL